MIQNISNTIGSLPVASIGCAAASLYIGRRWCAAGIYKAGTIGANIIGAKNAAEWKHASDESLTLAKKNGFRDLTAVGCLITAGLYSEFVQKTVCPPKKTDYFEDYGLPALKIGYVITAPLAGWYLKKESVLKKLSNSGLNNFENAEYLVKLSDFYHSIR